MNLINGRGQIGEYLSKCNKNLNNIDIYHTWNFLDKSKHAQEQEIEKLNVYLNKVEEFKKIIFISTSIENPSYYLSSKRIAETLILNKSPNNLIIRIPCIIGKGIFENLAKNIVTPYGVIKYTSLKEASKFIIESLNCSGIITCPHWEAPAEIIFEIMNIAKKFN